MKRLSCAICGKIFETARPNKKYCSFICKEAGRKLQHMKWADGHPGYSAEYMRRYRHEKRTENAQTGI